MVRSANPTLYSLREGVYCDIFKQHRLGLFFFGGGGGGGGFKVSLFWGVFRKKMASLGMKIFMDKS